MENLALVKSPSMPVLVSGWESENSLPKTGRVLTSVNDLVAERGKPKLNLDCLPGDQSTIKTSRTTSGAEHAVANFRGPFRVLLNDTVDLTPNSPLRQAILAVLVNAPRQIKARKALQDMFWSDVESSRASANLRTALYLLRRDLAALGTDVVRSDLQTVSLAPGCILTAPGTVGGMDFLEGIDLRLKACESFEDWLRQMRSAAVDHKAIVSHPKLGSRTGFPTNATPRAQTKHLALGLLPPIHAGLRATELIQTLNFVDRVAGLIVHTTTVDIHDLRGTDNTIVPLPLESGTGPTHWLQALVQRQDSRLSLRLRLQEASTQRLIWISEPVTPDQLEDADALGEILLDRLQSSVGLTDHPNLFPLSAIAALFSLEDVQVAGADIQLEKMLQNNGSPVLECLRLFTQVFKVNEGIGNRSKFDLADFGGHLARIPTSDPLLPLCQSLVGYSAHMLFAENDLAMCLVEDAFSRAPNLALNLDHLAALRLMNGDLAGAETAFLRCIKTGAFSPWRYTYEVTGAMISLAKGDFRQSLHFANQALFRKPRFIGALRYSMVGLAMSGKVEDAHRMRHRIHSLRPDLDLAEWAEGLLRRTSPDLGAALVGGLRNASIW